METKHTPGPWSFRPLMSEDNRGMGYIEDANGHDIIHAGVMDLPMHENQANAALIAAAPDLLEALKSAVERLERYNQCFGEVDDSITQADIGDWHNIIKKAEGR